MPDCQTVARQFIEEHQLTSETAYGFAGDEDPKPYFFEAGSYERLLEKFISDFTPREHFEIWYSCLVELWDGSHFFFADPPGFEKDATLKGFAHAAVWSTIRSEIPPPTQRPAS